MSVCPTRLQWRLLATLRDGPVPYLTRRTDELRNPRRGQRSGIANLRTSMSIRKRGWVLYDEAARHYALSDAGRDALAAGDRRYQESEVAYVRRLL